MKRQERNEVWDAVVKFYAENFGISSELVELMAVHDILKLCATGSTNKQIADYLGEDVSEVSRIIQKYYDNFDGWPIELKVNPYSIMSDVLDVWEGLPRFDAFRTEVLTRDRTCNEFEVYFMYDVSKVCHDLERRLRNEWV